VLALSLLAGGGVVAQVRASKTIRLPSITPPAAS
jgi:hypothetical protein